MNYYFNVPARHYRCRFVLNIDLMTIAEFAVSKYVCEIIAKLLQ